MIKKVSFYRSRRSSMEKGGGAIDFKPSLSENASSPIADFGYVFDIHTRVR